MQANATGVLAPNTEIALSLLQIVALLLPLAGIFFQLVLTSERHDALPDFDDVTTAIGAVLFTLVGTGLFAAVQVILGTDSIFLQLGVVYLAVALLGVGVVVYRIENALTNTPPTPAIRRIAPPGYSATREECQYERLSKEAGTDEETG